MPESTDKASPRIGQLVWSWGVVGTTILAILGFGVSFMTSGHAYIADLFFVAGIVLFLIKFLSWDLSKQHQRKGLLQVITIFISIIVLMGAVGGNHYLNYKPSEYPKNNPIDHTGSAIKPLQPKQLTAKEIADEVAKKLPQSTGLKDEIKLKLIKGHPQAIDGEKSAPLKKKEVQSSNTSKSESKELKQLKKQFAELGYPPIGYQPESIESNKPLPMPNLASIRIASQKQIVSTKPELPYGLEVIIQTDKVIEPVAFAIEFSGEVDFNNGDAGFTTGGVYTNVRMGLRWDGHPNVFGFAWDSPPFTPDKIIKVTIFSKSYVTATKLIKLEQ